MRILEDEHQASLRRHGIQEVEDRLPDLRGEELGERVDRAVAAVVGLVRPAVEALWQDRVLVAAVGLVVLAALVLKSVFTNPNFGWDVVAALRYLIDSPAVTGQVLTIDGGQRFWSLDRDVQFLEKQ